MRKTKSAGDEIVTMDRRSTRDRRTESRTKATEAKRATLEQEPPKSASPRAAKTPPSAAQETNAQSDLANNRRTHSDRRSRDAMPDNMAKLIAEEKRKIKVQRRRQIDPTTCERDYSGDEIVFMQAMDEYKRKNGRMFPTCSEILEVVRSIGYVKVSSNQPLSQPECDD